jgi:hypothetical protein
VVPLLRRLWCASLLSFILRLRQVEADARLPKVGYGMCSGIGTPPPSRGGDPSMVPKPCEQCPVRRFRRTMGKTFSS